MTGRIRLIALSGFLGAGKTTTMVAAAERMRAEGKRVAVITNDQSVALIDTALAARRLDGVDEVTGGCFCCRFDDLCEVATRLVEEHGAEVIIAESVGSCTDLTATVVRPMAALHGERFRVAPLTTVVDPLRYLRLAGFLDDRAGESNATYLFRKQLEDAAVIAVNKADLLDEDELTEVVDGLVRQFPQAEVVTYAAARGDLGTLPGIWERDHSSDKRDLDIDYLEYGVAEAKLAWLNRTAELTADGAPFVPAGWVRTVLDHVGAGCRERGYDVGHVKVLFEDEAGEITKASLVDADREATFDLAGAASAAAGTVKINGRVECEPAELEALVDAAVAVADARHGVSSVSTDQRAFKPGQPRPTHRITVGTG